MNNTLPTRVWLQVDPTCDRPPTINTFKRASVEEVEYIRADLHHALNDRIDELDAEHGSLRFAAQSLGISASYLSRLRSGVRDNPSAAVLEKLGLAKKTVYVRLP